MMRAIRKEFLVILAPLMFQMVAAMVALVVLVGLEGKIQEDHRKKQVMIVAHEVEQLHEQCLASAFFYGVTNNLEIKRVHEQSRMRLAERFEYLKTISKATPELDLELTNLEGSIERALKLESYLMNSNLLRFFDEEILVDGKKVNNQFLIDSTIQVFSSSNSQSGQSMNNAFTPVDGNLNAIYQAETIDDSLAQSARQAGWLLLLTGLASFGLSIVLLKVISEAIISKLRIVKDHAMSIALEQKLLPALLKGDDDLAILEHKIRDDGQKILELDRFKQDVISTVGHDVRAPLTSIQGFIALAKSGQFGEVDKSSLPLLLEIEEDCGRVKELIGLVLDFEKLNAGLVDVESETYDLIELVEAVQSLGRQSVPPVSFELEGDAFEVTFQGDLDAVARAVFYLVLELNISSDGGTKIVLRLSEGLPELIIYTKNGSGSGAHVNQESDYIKEHIYNGATKLLALMDMTLTECLVDEAYRGYRIILDASQFVQPNSLEQRSSIAGSGEGALKQKIEAQISKVPFLSLHRKLVLMVLLPCLVSVLSLFALGQVLFEAANQLEDETRARQVLYHADRITKDVANITLTAFLQNMTKRDDLEERRVSLTAQAKDSLVRMKVLLPEPRPEWQKNLISDLEMKIERIVEAQERMASADRVALIKGCNKLLNERGGLFNDAFGYVTEPLIKRYGLKKKSSIIAVSYRHRIELFLALSLGLGVLATCFSLFLISSSFTSRLKRVTRSLSDNLPESDNEEVISGSDEIALLETFLAECRAVIEHKELERLKLIDFLSTELSMRLSRVRQNLKQLSSKNSSIDEGGKERFIICRSEVQRLENFINDLVQLGAIEQGSLSVSLESVDIAKLLARVKDLLQPQANLDRVAIQVSCPDSLFASGDTERTMQVLFNLVHNAVKFSPANSIVDVTASADDDWVSISVKDMGPGIDTQMQHTIFERFQSLDEEPDVAAATRRSGHGLGLYIASILVELQGGEIGVLSEPGCGSTFWIKLPCYRKD